MFFFLSSKEFLKRHGNLLACLTIGTVAFAVGAFINGFPLVSGNDSNSYLITSVGMIPPVDRAVYYSVFLRFCRIFSASLWTVVFFQGLIASYLIYRLIRLSEGGVPLFLSIALVLSGASTLPWIAGQIMPDFFTGALGIVVFLILNPDEPVPAPAQWPVLGLFYVSLLTHFSHLPVVAMSIALYAGLQLIGQRRIRFLPLLQIALIIAASIGTTIVHRRLTTGKATYTPMSHAYLLARLTMDGVTSRLLNEHCAEEKYSFCEDQWAFRPRNVMKFLWTNGGVLPRFGGVEGTKGESLRVIWDALRFYPRLNLALAYHGTVAQWGAYDIGDEFNLSRRRTLYSDQIIETIYPADAAAFLYSKQATGEYGYITGFFHRTHKIVATISLYTLLAAMIIALFARPADPVHFLFPEFTLCFLLSNAFVMSFFSEVINRYQARVIWLAPLAAILVVRPAWQSCKKISLVPEVMLNGIRATYLNTTGPIGNLLAARSAKKVAIALAILAAGALVSHFRADQFGLLGEYFVGSNFTQRYRSRIDRVIEFDWRYNSPFNGWIADEYAVRWTGYLHAPVDGEYKFHMTNDDGARFWIGNILLIDDWKVHGPTRNSVAVTLKKGWYPIRIDYFEYMLTAVFKLRWEVPGVAGEATIPKEDLCPARELLRKGQSILVLN